MDWFERLTGFKEAGYDETRSQLAVEGRQLRSLQSGRSSSIGDLELVSLQTLRERVLNGDGPNGVLQYGQTTGDVRLLHQRPEFNGALFQVASQFNLLEMTSPDVTPEHGVTRYQYDRTQGPACAVAAGAATIYRNYFAPVAGEPGQTAQRQLNGLAPLGEVLAAATGLNRDQLWGMRNGYALATQAGLEAIAAHLQHLDPAQTDQLRGKLCVGVHSDVEVTDGDHATPPLVSQVFCSALPVAYSNVPAIYWAPFARLVLEAAYEATLCAGILNARRGASNIVLLTRLGGGAFGNEDNWIDGAMAGALEKYSGYGLDVRLVKYG